MTDKIVPGDGLEKIQPLLKLVYQEALTEQLKRGTVFSKFERTPEQQQKIDEARVKREKERQELLDLLATATGSLKAIVELHSVNKYDECDGCDLGSYAESGAQWPCRTIDLIAEELRGKD